MSKANNIPASKKEIEEIFTSCDDPYDQDLVMAEMFKAGVPFHELEKTYKSIGLSGGWIKRREDIANDVMVCIARREDEISSDDTTWDDIESMVEAISKEVLGISQDGILKIVRQYCKDKSINLPRKPRKQSSRTIRRRGGNIASVVIEYSNSNDPSLLTITGLRDAILKTTKDTASANRHASGLFPIVYCIVHQCSLKEFHDAAESNDDVFVLT